MRGLDGFTPLQDQSATGLLMMQIEGTIYLAVVLLLVPADVWDWSRRR